MLVIICMIKTWLYYLISSPSNSWRKWLNGDSHFQAGKKSHNSFFFKYCCSCIKNVVIFNLEIRCNEWHLCWLCYEVRVFIWFWFQLLSCLSHLVTEWSFIARSIQTSLSIESCLNDIKRSCWNWGQSSCNTTTKIIIEMVIAFFDVEGLFKFFIHQYNNWAERNIHKIVDEEASVERYDSLIFIHWFD